MKHDGRLVSKYLWSLKTMVDELGTIDHPLTNDDLTMYILKGLRPKFQEIVASLHTRDSFLSFDDLHNHLVTHEESLKRDELQIDSTPVTTHFATTLSMLNSSL